MNVQKMTAIEVAEYLSKSNDRSYNYTKLAEEMAELDELILKRVNKEKTSKNPPDELIAEEVGDTLFRLNVLMKMLGIRDKVLSRIDFKVDKYKSYIEENKYQGRI